MNSEPGDKRPERAAAHLRPRMATAAEAAAANAAAANAAAHATTAYADQAAAYHQYPEDAGAYQTAPEQAYAAQGAYYGQQPAPPPQTPPRRYIARFSNKIVEGAKLSSTAMIATALVCSSIIGGAILFSNHYSISAPNENLAYIINNLSGTVTICDKTACGQLENIGTVKRK